MASENVGYATLQIIPSMRGFGQKLQTAAGREVDEAGDSSGKRFGKGFLGGFLGGAVAGGLTILGGKIKEFGTGAVDVFSEVEDATGAAGVVFGKSVADITKFAATADSKYGLAQGAALNAALTFGTLGKAAGKQGPALSGFASEMAGLAGDLASFRGTSTEQAVEAVGAALRGEMEPIRAYGVLLDDATLRQQALKMGLIKTTKEALTPQQKTLAAQAAILAQTKDAQGDFQRTSESTANTQKRLQAATENAQAALGEKLAPAITKARQVGLGLIVGIGSLVDWLVVAGGKAQEFGGWISDNRTPILIVTGLIAAVFIPHLIALGVQSTISGAKQAAGWAMGRVGAVRAAAAHSLAVLKIVAGWVMMGVNAVRSGAQTVAIWALYRIEAAKGAAASVASAARVVGSWVLMGLQSMVQAGRMALAWVIGVVTGAATSVATMAVTAAAVVAGWVVMGVQSLIQAARMAAAWFIALGPIGWAIAAIIAIAVIVIANWDKISAWTAKAWTAMTGWVTSKAKAILGWLKANWPMLLAILAGPIGLAVRYVVTHWDKISAGARAMKDATVRKLGELVSFVASLPGRILSAIGNLGSLLIDKGASLVEGLISGISGMGGRLAGFVKQFIKDHIPAPVAKALRINSPSKVMADQAKWIPLGIIQGIESQRSQLDRTMAGLVKAPNMPSLDKAAIGAEKSSTSATAPGGSHRITGTLDLGNGLRGFVDGVIEEEGAAAGRGY